MQKVAKVADRIREAMDAAGLKASDLSNKADIPKSTVSRYLSGGYEPKSKAVYKMAQALDVSEAWLLGYDVPAARSLEQKRDDDQELVADIIRNNPKFLNVIIQLSELPEDQFEAVETLLSALVQK